MSEPPTSEAPALPLPPGTVGALARALHASDRQELEIDVPVGVQLQLAGVAGASVEDGKLRFATLEDRNRAVVSDMLEELGAPSTDPEALWAAAEQLWRKEIGNPDMASGRLLAAMHPQVDLLRTAASRITNARNAFDALQLVQAALLYLQALDWHALIALCEAEQPFTQGDLAGGMFYGNLARWLTTRPAAARELVELLLIDPGQSRGNLLGAAWMAWFGAEPDAATQRLLAEGAATGGTLRHVTCWIAGRMLAEPTVPAAQAPALEALILEVISAADAPARRAGMAAATSVLHLRRAFDDALRARIADGDTEAAAFVVQALVHNFDSHLHAGTFFAWLDAGVGLREGFEGVLGGLDHMLSTLLQPGAPHVDAVFAFLESWIRCHASAGARKRDFAEQFGSCTREILSHPRLLGRMVTHWMLQDGRALPDAAAGVILTPGSSGTLTLGFDPEMLDAATESDLRFVAKRILGFLIEAEHMLSLALSLLRLRDAKARVHPMMWWLLYEEIGYDYRDTTIKRLRAHVPQEHDVGAKALLSDIAARLEADEAALDALPRLRELTVPQALRREFRKARDKQMERTVRDGQKRSVLMRLVTQIHIKAGNGTFQYLGDQFSEPTGFASHSFSIELPRREVLDPVGNTYRLLQLRSAKRESA